VSIFSIKLIVVGEGGVPCRVNCLNGLPFEPMSKRRRGYPSETRVKAGVRVVHGEKLLEEKLGRNDLCPCGSGQRFKRCCLRSGRF
jgi:SEC-C motif